MYQLSCSIGAKLTEPGERIPRIVAWHSDRLSILNSLGTACRPKLEIQPQRAQPEEEEEAIKEPWTAG